MAYMAPAAVRARGYAPGAMSALCQATFNPFSIE